MADIKETTDHRWTADPGLASELPVPTGVAINPMTTAGDIIVGGTGGAETRLAKGADGSVLTIDPGTHLPVWVPDTDLAPPVTITGTNPATTPLTIASPASQTAGLFEVKDSNGVAIAILGDPFNAYTATLLPSAVLGGTTDPLWAGPIPGTSGFGVNNAGSDTSIEYVVGGTPIFKANVDGSVTLNDPASGGATFQRAATGNLLLSTPPASSVDPLVIYGPGGFGGSPLLSFTNAGLLKVVAANTQTTVGAAGLASALPALPSGYKKEVINGVTVVIPYYAAS